MADYGSLSTYLSDAKREATIAEMTCNGWEFEDERRFTKSESGPESYSSMSVTLDGQASGYISAGGTTTEEPRLAQLAREELDKVRSKWETNLDHAVNGWDSLPEEDGYDGAIDQIRLATKLVATGTGNGGSAFGNPDLTEIGFIRARLPENSGQTINEFYRIYGPEKLELVFDGSCEVMACLGVALAGEKNVLVKTRADVAQVFSVLPEAFRQTRQNNSTDWEAVISVATAAFGLVGAFGAGVPGLAAAVGAATATGGFLTAAMGALSPKESEEKKPYTGSHPDDVYRDLESALGSIDATAASIEDDLATMLSNMTGYIADTGNRQSFHIHPDAGLARSFGESDDIIDLKYPVLETIGYTSMPKIAKGFLDGADAAQAGQQQTAWYRPWSSVPGSAIGRGAYGAYYEWESLLYAIFPLMNSNGAEVLRAGEHLAEAAGYVRDSDDWARRALGDDYEDVRDAGLGWEKPYTEPAPPPYPTTGGRRPIPQ